MNIRQSEHDYRQLFARLKHPIEYIWQNHLRHLFKKEDIVWETLDNFMQINGIDIPRPNHGMPHTLRMTALIPLIIEELYKKHANENGQKILTLYDERRILLLMLAALFTVVCRKDEIGFDSKVVDPVTGKVIEDHKIYLGYKQASADAFYNYCKKHGDIFAMTPKEIDYYTKIVKEMGDPEIIKQKNKAIGAKKLGKRLKGPEGTLLDYSIIHLAHCLDLFRCSDADRMRDVLMKDHELYDAHLEGDFKTALARLIGTSIGLIKLTGDRLVSSYQYDKNDLNKDPFIGVSRSYDKTVFSKVAMNPNFARHLILEQLRRLDPVNENLEYEHALSTLLQGPRQQTQATKDLQVICDALLYNSEMVRCQRNNLKEIEVVVAEDKFYNLAEILRNNADFEQLTFLDEQVSAYVDFLKNEAKHKPRFTVTVNGVAQKRFPTEEDYETADTKKVGKRLRYGEKLAITLYSGNEFYKIAHDFLRTNGVNTVPVYEQKSDGVALLVKEVLLLSAFATQGLMKLGEPDETPTMRFLFRAELPSIINEQRYVDMVEDNVTLQKGFSSFSESTTIAEKMFAAKNSAPTHIGIMLYDDVFNGSRITVFSEHPDELEHLFSPGTEFKYCLNLRTAEFDEFFGFPVRTIECEKNYAYDDVALQTLRNELINQLVRFRIFNINSSMSDIEKKLYVYSVMLKHINVSEEEFHYLQGITNYFQSAGAKVSLTYEMIDQVEVDQLDVFSFFLSLFNSSFKETLQRVMVRHANLFPPIEPEETICQYAIRSNLSDLVDRLIDTGRFHPFFTLDFFKMLDMVWRRKLLVALFSRSIFSEDDLNKFISQLCDVGIITLADLSYLANNSSGLKTHNLSRVIVDIYCQNNYIFKECNVDRFLSEVDNAFRFYFFMSLLSRFTESNLPLLRRIYPTLELGDSDKKSLSNILYDVIVCDFHPGIQFLSEIGVDEKFYLAVTGNSMYHITCEQHNALVLRQLVARYPSDINLRVNGVTPLEVLFRYFKFQSSGEVLDCFSALFASDQLDLSDVRFDGMNNSRSLAFVVSILAGVKIENRLLIFNVLWRLNDVSVNSSILINIEDEKLTMAEYEKLLLSDAINEIVEWTTSADNKKKKSESVHSSEISFFGLSKFSMFYKKPEEQVVIPPDLQTILSSSLVGNYVNYGHSLIKKLVDIHKQKPYVIDALKNRNIFEAINSKHITIAQLACLTEWQIKSLANNADDADTLRYKVGRYLETFITMCSSKAHIA